MTSTDLVKVSADFTPKSVAALEAAAEMAGNNQTDTINRAVQIYAYLTDLRQQGYTIQYGKERGWGWLSWGRAFAVKWIDRDGVAR